MTKQDPDVPMNVDDSQVNQYTTNLLDPIRRRKEDALTFATGEEKHSTDFTMRQLQLLLDAKTEILMKVAHDGPLLSDSERNVLEKDLGDIMPSLPHPTDLLSVIRTLNAIELILSTLVVHNPGHYNMSQLWGTASKYMGSALYKKNIDIQRQPHWIAMRRAATAHFVGNSFFHILFESSLLPEDFDSPMEFLETLAWVSISYDTCKLTIYDIASKTGQLMGQTSYWDSVIMSLGSSDPVFSLKREQIAHDTAWKTAIERQGLQKNKKRPRK